MNRRDDPAVFTYAVEIVRLGIIKIGSSRNVSQRFMVFRSIARRKYQSDAVLLGFVPGGSKVELELHKKLSRFRVEQHCRELFSKSPFVMRAISGLICTKGRPKEKRKSALMSWLAKGAK